MKRKGFSLIELMVVIAIVGILATIGLVTYSNTQKISRDARRKQDLKTLQIALELYHQAHGSYPVTGAPTCGESDLTFGCSDDFYWGWLRSTGSVPWIPGLQDFVSGGVLPIDPVNTYSESGTGVVGSDIHEYAYRSYYSGCPAPGTWYALATLLDNPSDPDTLANKPIKWCDGTDLLDDIIPGGGKYLMIILNN